MSVADTSQPFLRIPPWLKVPLPEGKHFCQTSKLVTDLGLRTVCSSAKCPNKFECFSAGRATFLILGANCTRNCTFCNITHASPTPINPDEPAHIASVAQKLQLRHVVITSVTRDDLPDGGASHFAATITALQTTLPETTIEVLIPDFNGNEQALQTVLQTKVNIINHNVETAPALYKQVRPQANYAQSLQLLQRVKDAGATSKSGLMVGLGETDKEVYEILDDLAAIRCDIVTIGQYMQPSQKHPLVRRYVTPQVFEDYAEYGKRLGIPFVFSAPLVRSSYNAEEAYKNIKTSL